MALPRDRLSAYQEDGKYTGQRMAESMSIDFGSCSWGTENRSIAFEAVNKAINETFCSHVLPSRVAAR